MNYSGERLNERFEVSAEEATQLWISGQPMPIESRRAASADRIRLSENGAWVVKLDYNPSETLDAEAACEHADIEFDRMQEAGVPIISNARTPSMTGTRIFTVTPAIEGIQRCDYGLFKAEIYPFLKRYFKEARDAGIKPKVDELACSSQCSVAPLLSEAPFLHDVDIRAVL